MKSTRIIAVALLALGTANASLDASEGIRGGYAGTQHVDHVRSLVESGMNAHFMAFRPAPAMSLALGTDGTVIRKGIDAEFDQDLRRYLNMARQKGLNIYATVGFHDEYVKQLSALGEYHKAVVQGPYRYVSPGEKAAPAPFEERYWLGQLLCEAIYAAELAKQYPNVKGFLVDMEMYASGAHLWRWQSSFDDQTFTRVIQAMRARGDIQNVSEALRAPAQQRYEWLHQRGLLEAYFDVQGSLVADLARRFREKVHAVNPDLALGILYYEPNWFHDGWARGLGTPSMPALVASELEYGDGITPSAVGHAQRLQAMGIHATYIPGFHLYHYSPGQLAAQIAQANRRLGHYWLFTTYSLWQPEPQKLWGPYTIHASRDQYWEAIRSANAGGATARLGDYLCDNAPLLTGNRYYEGTQQELPVRVAYSRAPDVPFYTDADGRKLFDGIERTSPGTVAWYPKADETIQIDVDLSEPVMLEKILLRAGHELHNHPALKEGKITVTSSLDGQMFYPLLEAQMPAIQLSNSLLIREGLGIQARYLRISLEAKSMPAHSAWAVSELALWGTPQTSRH